MRTFSKIVAAALLSTTLSGAVMAAVDLNNPFILADTAKLNQVKTIVRANTYDGVNYEIHFDANLVDSLLVMDSTRFTKHQTKNFLDGMKRLYTELTDAAGGLDRLKAKLSSTSLVANLVLDPTTADADVHNAANAASLKALTDAVIDDPFKAIDESFLTLRGTSSAIKPTTGSAMYVTFEHAITAYERAKAAKDLSLAQYVLDEINKMRDNKGRSFQEIIAHKQKK